MKRSLVMVVSGRSIAVQTAKPDDISGLLENKILPQLLGKELMLLETPEYDNIFLVDLTRGRPVIIGLRGRYAGEEILSIWEYLKQREDVAGESPEVGYWFKILPEIEGVISPLHEYSCEGETRVEKTLVQEFKFKKLRAEEEKAVERYFLKCSPLAGAFKDAYYRMLEAS